jgi:ABC-type glycerol-3-phosphate transport system substrate-binding protein
MPGHHRRVHRSRSALTGGGVAAFGLVGAKHATQLMQFANWLYAHGGHFVSEDGSASVFDSPNAVAALQFYADLFKEHEITQLSAVSDSRNEVRQLFFTEQLAMFVDGPWARAPSTRPLRTSTGASARSRRSLVSSATRS